MFLSFLGGDNTLDGWRVDGKNDGVFFFRKVGGRCGGIGWEREDEFRLPLDGDVE